MCLCVREGENGGALACDGEGGGGRWWVKQRKAQQSKARSDVKSESGGDISQLFLSRCDFLY